MSEIYSDDDRSIYRAIYDNVTDVIVKRASSSHASIYNEIDVMKVCTHSDMMTCTCHD